MYFIKRISLIVLLNLPAPTLCDLVRTLMPEPSLTSRQQAALLKHRKRFSSQSSSHQLPGYSQVDPDLPLYSLRISEQPSVYNSAHHASPPPYSSVDPLERLKRRQEKAFQKHLQRNRRAQK